MSTLTGTLTELPQQRKQPKNGRKAQRFCVKYQAGKQRPRPDTGQVCIYEPQLMIANSNKNIQHSYLQSNAKSKTEPANIINTGQLDIQGYVGAWARSHHLI